MIPTAILAGLILGVWIRWWAVPVVGLWWAIIILFMDPGDALFGGLLGAANGLVGVLPALGMRKLGSQALAGWRG